ncbi:MAG: tetratricopeptide repeat protein [Endomicrobiaceae bacterium]|nr:tetratricopeptide repeat protein [Endomicrobiaceae bacterium]MDD5102678.1 tetratricopeptide repeat protein [Endomicrobiaceae bacterium]
MKRNIYVISLIFLMSLYVNIYAEDIKDIDDNIINQENIEYSSQMPDMADTIKAFQNLQKELDENVEGLNYEQLYSAAEKDMTDIEGMNDLLKSSAQIKKTQQNMISKMSKAANSGNLGAQFQLGMTYASGVINTKDSIKWLKKAAEKNHRGAQYILGFIYGYGDGVEKNIKEAKKWLNRAVKQGHKEAKKYLDEINNIK